MRRLCTCPVLTIPLSWLANAKLRSVQPYWWQSWAIWSQMDGLRCSWTSSSVTAAINKYEVHAICEQNEDMREDKTKLSPPELEPIQFPTFCCFVNAIQFTALHCASNAWTLAEVLLCASGRERESGRYYLEWILRVIRHLISINVQQCVNENIFTRRRRSIWMGYTRTKCTIANVQAGDRQPHIYGI